MMHDSHDHGISQDVPRTSSRPLQSSSEPVRDYRRYLDPRTLAKIGRLNLRARLVVEGYISGMHRSPYRGYSIEFADHRQYVQGDDIRHIDWKVFGRTNKYYIKQYEEETNLVLMLAVDCSESMSYKSPSSPMSKHEYGISIAASLAYLALRQQDSVGLACFDESVTRYLRPTNHTGQWKAIIHELDGATGPSKTSLKGIMDDLAERTHRRSLVVIISDFLDSLANIQAGLRHLKYRKNELILCHVMDPAELDLPFDGPIKFNGLEAGGHLLTEPKALKTRYRQEVETFIADLKKTSRELRLDYALYNTRNSLDVALSSYLATRSARIR